MRHQVHLKLLWTASWLSLVALAALIAPAAAQVTPPPPLPGLDPLADTAPDPDGVEPLVKGPIHEAYAAPTETDPKPPPIVAKKPPADIEEEAPDLKPEGAIWIGGYWEWDDELKDFLWVSGHWRIPPPGMRWVPSYWSEADGGWQRVPGLWIGGQAGELEYREAPPESLEAGPTSPAPADNYFWIPGCWSYYDTGYRWRTGYWSPYQSDWVWCPARWAWTPGGYLQCPGFWDFRLAFRGQLFAPICFNSPIYTTPGWCFRPQHVLDCNRLFVNLWIRPNYGCYYFGNYYDARYSNWGFTPWCNWHTQRRCYDPLLTWCNVHYRRQGVDFVGRCQNWHKHFKDHDHDRPPHTFREQNRLVNEGKLDRSSNRFVAADLKDVAKRDDLPVRLTKVDDKSRQLARKGTEEFRDLHTARSKIEREAKLARGNDLGRDRGAGGVNLPVTSSDGKTAKVDASSSSGQSERVTARVQELQNRLSSGSEKRESFKFKLPAASEAAGASSSTAASIRNSGSNSSSAFRNNTGNDGSSGDLPRLSGSRERLSRESSGTTTTRSGSGNSQGNSSSNTSGFDRSSTSSQRSNSTNIDALRNRLESRSPSTSGASQFRSNSSSGSSGNNSPRFETPRTESPRLESPRSLPKFEAPKSIGPSLNRSGDSGGSRSNSLTPRSFESRGSSMPKIDAPRTQSRSFESPRSSGPSISPRSFSLPSGSARSASPSFSRSMDSGSIRNFSSRSSGSSGPRLESRSSGGSSMRSFSGGSSRSFSGGSSSGRSSGGSSSGGGSRSGGSRGGRGK